MRIAMAQITVIPGEVPENIARARDAILAAGERGADVVVVPETCDVGWASHHAQRLAQPIPGPTFDALAQQAATSGVAVVAGLTERSGTRVYNASVLIDSQGQLRGTHRKVHELDFAQKVYSTGDTVSVVHAERYTAGIAICADNSMPTLAIGTTMAHLGARVMLSPCAWAVPPGHDPHVTPYDEWHAPYTHLARTTGMPVIGVSNVGPVVGGAWDGWRCIGRSLAVNGDGSVVYEAPYGEEDLAIVEVDVSLT